MMTRISCLVVIAMTWAPGVAMAQRHADGAASSSLTYFSETHSVADGGSAHSASSSRSTRPVKTEWRGGNDVRSPARFVVLS